jgi:hypothetical protein
MSRCKAASDRQRTLALPSANVRSATGKRTSTRAGMAAFGGERRGSNVSFPEVQTTHGWRFLAEFSQEDP